MNNIFDVIFFILGLILAFALREKFSIEDEEDVPTQKERITIKVERIDEVFYAWHNNDFLVQSRRIEDILQHIKEKFPNKNFSIVSDKEMAKWLQIKKI